LQDLQDSGEFSVQLPALRGTRGLEGRISSDVNGRDVCERSKADDRRGARAKTRAERRFRRMIFRVQFLDVSARHRVVERQRATDQK
jgi:hypothetical protein